MNDFFNNLKEEVVSRIGPNTKYEDRIFLQKIARQLIRYPRSSLIQKIRVPLLNKRSQYTTNPMLVMRGGFYLGEYEPESKDFMWDRYPLFLVLDRPKKDKILGLNLHFLSEEKKMEVFNKIQPLLPTRPESVGQINYLACKLLLKEHRLITRRYDTRRFVKLPINIPYEHIKFLLMMDLHEFSVGNVTDDDAYEMLTRKIRKR